MLYVTINNKLATLLPKLFLQHLLQPVFSHVKFNYMSYFGSTFNWILLNTYKKNAGQIQTKTENIKKSLKFLNIDYDVLLIPAMIILNIYRL